MNLTIYTDGGSLNNPGPAACSFLIYHGKKILHKAAFFLGPASNNVAEYSGLIRALEKIKEIKKTTPISSLTCFADSKLLIMQLKGLYKIKHPDMKKLSSQIRLLEMEIGITPSYKHIPREENQLADALVKEVLT